MPAYMGGTWFPPSTPVPRLLDPIFPHGLPRIDLIWGVTDPRISITFYALTMVAALLTCLGLFTRYSAFALAIGLISLHHRDGAMLHGGDTVMRLLVIYVAVSPSGRACSLDRLIGLWKGTIGREPIQISLWSERLIAFNTALIYFTTIWLKWDGPKWRNFTATYYPEHLTEFYRFPVPDFLRSMWVARVSTTLTIVTEFCLATLVFFPPARRWVLMAGVIMHAWIEYSMNIPLFSYLMLTCYIAFYQGEEIQAWAQRTGMRLRKYHVTVRLPEGQKLRPNAAAFLSALDPFGMVAYMPGDTPEFHASRFDGSSILPGKAIMTRSIGAWPALWLPGIANRLLSRSTEEIPAVAESTAANPDAPRKEHAGSSPRRKRK